MPGKAPDEAAIRAIDKEIMLEGIKLARFNIHFHQARSKHYRGRNLLYPLIQESGSACSLAGTIIDLSDRAGRLSNPRNQNIPLVKRGLETSLVGQAIKGTEFSAELAINIYLARQAAANGFSYKDATEFVQLSRTKSERLLHEREALLADTDPELSKLYVLEGRMMRHLANQLIYEFKLLCISAVEQQWQENSFYTMVAGQNFTLMGSSMCSLQSFTKPTYTGRAACANITASSIGVAAPILRTAIGRMAGKIQSRRLAKELPLKRDTPRHLAELQADWQDLGEYMAQKSGDKQADKPTGLLGLDMLIFRSDREDTNLRNTESRIGRLRRVAQQQAIQGPLIEMASLSRQICQEVAYSRYRFEPSINNRINLAGRIVQVAGQGYGLISTPVTSIRAALLERRLRRENKLPAQLYAARLQRLADLEKRLNAL